MKGDIGDGAIYIDRSGERHRAIIQSESIIGQANLVYWSGEKPSKKNMNYTINVPHKSESSVEKNVYKHKPSADWTENLL